ncbi:MAG: hypothetical protein ACAF41_26960 [Leptolyngbya sp. BL-A-14]
MAALFNAKNAIATADLPCNLAALAANLSLIAQISAKALIQHHTLYPFYAPFLPQARSQQILEAMHPRMVVAFMAELVFAPVWSRFPAIFGFAPMHPERPENLW